MLTVIRRSQLLGLMAIDSATANRLGTIEEIWLDDQGHVSYLSYEAGYLPLNQVANITSEAVSLYGYLPIEAPESLWKLHQQAIRSTQGTELGWLEDVLFDWHTGEVTAYVVTGEIAAPVGDRAVLFPQDIVHIEAQALIVSTPHLTTEREGLHGFFSEVSQQVKQAIHLLGDRLHPVISPQDPPDTVRVKIQTAGEELQQSGHPDHQTLQEATQFLQEQWHHLQHSIQRAGERAQSALKSAWHELSRR